MRRFPPGIERFKRPARRIVCSPFTEISEIRPGEQCRASAASEFTVTVTDLQRATIARTFWSTYPYTHAKPGRRSFAPQEEISTQFRSFGRDTRHPMLRGNLLSELRSSRFWNLESRVQILDDPFLSLGSAGEPCPSHGREPLGTRALSCLKRQRA